MQPFKAALGAAQAACASARDMFGGDWGRQDSSSRD